MNVTHAMVRWRALGAVVLAITGIAATTAARAEAEPPPPYVKIIARHSGKCLDVRSGAGAAVLVPTGSPPKSVRLIRLSTNGAICGTRWWRAERRPAE